MSGDCMRFPDTVEEFMEQYKVVDKEGIYMSKGAKLVPIFRMDQWFEHEKAQLSQEGTTKGTTTDTISRQAAIEVLYSVDEYNPRSIKAIKDLPSVQLPELYDYNYERAVEQLEHDILYEPTFNQEDGSM